MFWFGFLVVFLFCFNSTQSAIQQSFHLVIFLDINTELRLIYPEVHGNLFINSDIGISLLLNLMTRVCAHQR